MIAAPAVRVLNHLLDQGAWARAKLAPFAGRRARFLMPPWQLDLIVAEGGLFAAPADDAPNIDVTVALPADSPLTALQGIERVMAAAHVTGNAEFATELSFVLRNLRWDAEEDLSRLVGDIAAHRLVRTATGLAAWHQRGVDNLTRNITEYLSEEARLLTPARELTTFRRDNEDLAGRLAALAARVKHLS